MKPSTFLHTLEKISWRQGCIPALIVASVMATTPVGGSVYAQDSHPVMVEEGTETISISTPNYEIEIVREGFRYQFVHSGGLVLIPAHPVSGLQLSRAGALLSDVRSTKVQEKGSDSVVLEVTTEAGLRADVRVRLAPQLVQFSVHPRESGAYDIVGRTSGVSPAYGLGDHAAFGHGDARAVRSKVELTGFTAAPLRGHRMISNFVIFPKHGFAEVNIEPKDKIVRLTAEENGQGSMAVRQLPALYYFFGTPKEIYKNFLDVRTSHGYPVYEPKYAMFGVGWEAFGALAWDTRQETVLRNVETYLDLGYPLSWMVVGSGFWPRADEEFDEYGTPNKGETLSPEARKLLATTSFGMWDEVLYPDPQGLIGHFHERGLKFLIGLRVGFIPGGPYTSEGLKRGYFIEDDGEAQLFEVGFPESPVYLVDSSDPEAVEWYVGLADKWLSYGVDGFKEDLYGFTQELSDDMVDPVNRVLMDRGVYLIGRNNYLGSPADIHRYNDFNYFHPQDRGPINGLAFAYSGFPYVYPDIVGGTGLATGRHGDTSSDEIKAYLMRYAQYASLNPSMAFGYGPWEIDDERVHRVTLNAAKLHDRLHPYIYDAALDAHRTGFPYTMTPLPLAYPDDPNVYGLADTTRRSYEWLIGESLLATPLYGDDFATAESRDVYLPDGIWIDYDTGEMYEGPTVLENFQLPVGKTPLFVGGNGIVVEERWGHLFAHVYPIREETSMLFHHQNGEVSDICVNVDRWSESGLVEVIEERTGKAVETQRYGRALAFQIEPGRSYHVRSVKLRERRGR